MKKYLYLLIVMICSLIIISCDDSVATITSISVDEATIPNYVLIQKFDEQINNIKLNVNKSDDTIETKNITKDMISEQDLANINSLGKQKIMINYESFSTELSLNIKNYEVSVVYPDGTSAGKNIQVQWCDNRDDDKGVCYTPEVTNENGKAAIKLGDGEYIVHLENIPEGYTYNPNIYITNSENYSLIVKLIALKDYTSGEGTSVNPYVVNCGTYNSTYEALGFKNGLYFTFTAEEDGKYNITSISMDKLSQKKVDPYIGFWNSEVIDINAADVSGNNAEDINFNYTFDAKKGVKYTFVLFVSNVTTNFENVFPVSFEFTIGKID